jgi:hypothetical protein
VVGPGWAPDGGGPGSGGAGAAASPDRNGLLGDRCVPSRRCAGVGRGPHEPVVLLTAVVPVGRGGPVVARIAAATGDGE